MKKFIFILIFCALWSCKKEFAEHSKSNHDSIKKANTSPKKTDSINLKNTEEKIKNLNSAILLTIKDKDLQSFAKFIHPQKGILFSMYSFVDFKNDKNFTKEEFNKYSSSNTKFTWGNLDGSGEKLILSIKDYFSKWIWKKDLSRSQFSYNSLKSKGNTMENVKEFFPDAVFTENYLPGTKKYEEMDWNSLRFVFEKLEDNYYLVAVINNSWTI